MTTKSVTFGGVITFPQKPKEGGKKDDLKSFKNRFNCGALRNSLKMVSANGSTFISVRLARSKLRKREDAAVVTTNHNNNVIQQQDVVITTTPAPAAPVEPPPFLWRYSNGVSNASSQYSLCNNDQTTLVHNLPCDDSECKGFKKNLREKIRTLVKKKHQEVYTIPAELKPQLKQIYVY